MKGTSGGSPKYRFRILIGAVEELLEKDILTLCEWKDVEVLEQLEQADQVHLVCSVPPKLSILPLMGLLKGKPAFELFKRYPGLKRKPYGDG